MDPGDNLKHPNRELEQHLFLDKFAMATTEAYTVRADLVERRTRLRAASGSISDDYLNELLAEADAALEKIEVGRYGLCETCNDPIEEDRLELNPLCRFCLDHLNETERASHQKDLDLATQIQFQLLPPRSLTSNNGRLNIATNL